MPLVNRARASALAFGSPPCVGDVEVFSTLPKRRSAKPGYPKLFGNSFYGDDNSVVYETQKLTMAIHFPRWVKLQSSRVLVVDKHTREEHRAETERCMAIVQLMEKPADPERVIELVVSQPLVNHCYYLLYDLKD